MEYGWAFRGQPNAAWPLRPALLRELDATTEVTEEQALKLEKYALCHFRERAHLHLDGHVLPQREDVLVWWTLMQHYGAPTRMLDWTESPYVAAYFAALERPDDDGAVWAVHIGYLRGRMDALYGAEPSPYSPAQITEVFLEPGEPLVLFTPKSLIPTDRMIAQRGLFTVCRNVLGDHGEIMAETLPPVDNRTWLVKVVLPARVKAGFLRHLRAMNITADSLFPGPDGLGRSVRELTRLVLSN